MKIKRKTRQPQSATVDFITLLSPEDCHDRLEAASSLSQRLSLDDFAKHVLFLPDDHFVLEYKMKIGYPAVFRLRGALEPADTGTRIYGEWRGPILARTLKSPWSCLRANLRDPLVRRHMTSTVLAALASAALLASIGWVLGWLHDETYQIMLVIAFFMVTWQTASSIVRLTFGTERVYDQYSAQDIAQRFQFLMTFQPQGAAAATIEEAMRVRAESPAEDGADLFVEAAETTQAVQSKES